MEDTSFISGDCDAVSSKNSTDTSCGIGNCHPKCLQRFAHPRCFLFFFSLIGILQGAYFTYFIGILSTLEKRYSFDSWITGIILIADNLSPALFGIFVGYYGKYVHKPRLVTFGMMVTVLSCFLSSLPYFLFGSSIKSSRLSEENVLCNESVKDKECSLLSQNITAIIILFLANFLNGFGSMAYYTVGTPYMDDNVKGKNSPLYLGTTFSLRIIGPTLGFMLSFLCLEYYEDPVFDPGFDNRDPKWVGAWWMGFLLLGFAIFLASLPLAFFPKHLANNTSSDDEESIASKNSFAELFLALKKLIKNPILMFHTMSIIFQINGLFGYLVFMPKYIENQYGKTASSASLFSGNVTLVAMVIGVFLGGYCIHKVKPRARFLVGYMLIVELFAGIAIFSAIFMGCESSSHQENMASLLSVEPKACNLNCACDSRIFSPVCDLNKKVHFSPCSAGCYNFTIVKSGRRGFLNCSCVSPDSDGTRSFSATRGFCPIKCSMFLSFLIIITVAKMLSATARVGNVLITLRCVDEKDKTFALGAVEVVISVFATIPFPLFYGYIINKACILWDKSCKYQGNCWLYDNTLFRYYLHSVSVGFIFLAICCDFVVFLMSPKMRDLYGRDRKPTENLDLNVVNS